MALTWNGGCGSGGGTSYIPGEGISITGNVISAIMNATNTYTKAQVDQLIGDLEHVRMTEVATLPATGESNVIYLVPKTGGGYEMWVWDETNQDFVDVGGTDIDLTNYVTKTELATQTSTQLTLPEVSPAESAHAVGEYLIYNNALYRVTDAIAVGDTLTAGTNITQTSVGEELMRVNASSFWRDSSVDVFARRVGNLVNVGMQGYSISPITVGGYSGTAAQIISILPEQYRPGTIQYIPGFYRASSAAANTINAYMKCHSAGQISVARIDAAGGGTGVQFMFNGWYLAAN